jgi:hypothetical protein
MITPKLTALEGLRVHCLTIAKSFYQNLTYWPLYYSFSEVFQKNILAMHLTL